MKTEVDKSEKNIDSVVDIVEVKWAVENLRQKEKTVKQSTTSRMR